LTRSRQSLAVGSKPTVGFNRDELAVKPASIDIKSKVEKEFSL
jgi:hypothetical protein